MDNTHSGDLQAQLAILIKMGNFEEAEVFLETNFKTSQYIRTLHYITEQQTGLMTYTFVNYMLQKHSTAFWHRVAACIASESLDHIPEGSHAGLYHILRAIELSPDDYMLKEYALGYYQYGILDKEKARELALAVLQQETQNKLALKIMSEI